MQPYSLRAFEEYQNPTPISLSILILIFLSFQSQNYSKFNNSYSISLNIMKPLWCIPTHQGLPNGIKNVVGGAMVQEISM
jgi:hypothetical protein